MLTVVTPADSTHLTTVAAVRAETGVTTAEMTDEQVKSLIDQASGLVSEHCGRTFVRERVKESFPGSHSGAVILSRIPVASIVSVSAGGTVLTADQYRIELASGIINRVSGHCIRHWGYAGVEVVYDAGFIPPDEEGRNLPMMVERAAILVAAAILAGRRRDPLTKSESVDGVGRTDFWVAGQNSTLPHPEAEGLLRPFVMARLF